MDITQIVLDKRNNMMMMHIQLALVLVSGNSLTKVSHYMFMLEAECYHHIIYKLPHMFNTSYHQTMINHVMTKHFM